jgi:hypothetical protein
MNVGLFILFLWPLVTYVLFRLLAFQSAIVWSIIGGYLLLPSAREVKFNLPLLPALDKELVPTLTVAVIAFLTVREAVQRRERTRRRGDAVTGSAPVHVMPGWLPRSPIVLILFFLVMFGPLATALTNTDPLAHGPLVLPGLRIYDGLSMVLKALVPLLTLIVGRKYLSNDTGHRTVLHVLCIAGAVYALLALYEVRMSPQLNYMVYGFFPHEWIQHIRAGGFRPLVFLDHGLFLGIFLACSVLACAVLIRSETRAQTRFFYSMTLVWLLGVLFLSKTLGALVLAIGLLPVVMFLGIRLRLLIAGLVAISTLLYPTLRSSDLIPTEEIVAQFQAISTQRANSLQFRFDNEDALLDHARERPLFGWGIYGRALVYNEEGRDAAVADGVWVIIFGQRGWIGYIGIFGVLTLPLIQAFLYRKRLNLSPVTGGLCIVVAANLADLLPNSGMTPVLWLMVGAVLGRIEAARSVDQSEDEAIAESRPAVQQAASRHSRFPQNKQRNA